MSSGLGNENRMMSGFMPRRKRRIRMALLESVFAFWILLNIFMWITSATDIRSHLLKRSPKEVALFIENSRKTVWPYIWRQYRYANPTFEEKDR